MNKSKTLFLSIFVFALALFSYKITYSLFTNSATSTNNSFTAAASFPTPSPTPISSPVPGDVVINEINWGGSNVNGSSGADDEWIELHNTTNHSIDISNWVVLNLGFSVNSTITITSGATIPANGFYLISHYLNTNANSALNITPDMSGVSINLNDAGEQLTLKTSSSGTVIDTANGSGAWFAGTKTNPIKSMERNSTPGDGTVSGSWHTATTHVNMKGSTATDESGTPKATND